MIVGASSCLTVFSDLWSDEKKYPIVFTLNIWL